MARTSAGNSANPTVALVVRMSVNDAVGALRRAGGTSSLRDPSSVVSVIASVMVLDAVSGVAKDVFIRTVERVDETSTGPVKDPLLDDDVVEVSAWLQGVAGALSGPARFAVQEWQEVQSVGTSTVLDPKASASMVDGVARDVHELIVAVKLLRQWLASTSSSSAQPSSLRLHLLHSLASSVFSQDEHLEDARDSVVDLVSYNKRSVH